jgi:hypothetical protein
VALVVVAVAVEWAGAQPLRVKGIREALRNQMSFPMQLAAAVVARMLREQMALMLWQVETEVLDGI